MKIRKRRVLGRDLREEIAFHRAMRARDAQSKTDAPPFGNETQIREEIRNMWTFVSIENTWRGVYHALRGLRRNPGFTVIAILTLADVVQEAFCRAMEVWRFRGVPKNPSAWLMAAAKNCGLDVLRCERTVRTFAPEVERLFQSEWTLAPVVEECFGVGLKLADGE